jgi:hypothetical protein
MPESVWVSDKGGIVIPLSAASPGLSRLLPAHSLRCHIQSPIQKRDADHVFYELTRSICPECRPRHRRSHPDSRQEGLYAETMARSRTFRRPGLRGRPAIHQLLEVQQARHHPAGVCRWDQKRLPSRLRSVSRSPSSTHASESLRSTVPATWRALSALPRPVRVPI